jgi:hypothetical protein
LSTFYVLALCGVSVIVLGLMIDSMARVSAKPEWHVPAYEPRAVVEERPVIAQIPVQPVEERHSGFVGLTNNEEFQLTA